MSKKFVAIFIILILIFQTATVSATPENTVKQAVLKTLNQLKDQKYPMPDNVLNTMPGQYAAEVAKYNLTSSEAKLFINELNVRLLNRPEQVARDDQKWIESEVADIIDKAVTKYTFPKDKPSKWARTMIANMIQNGTLPQYFQKNYQKPITLRDLARLNFDTEQYTSYFENVDVVDPSITEDMPTYVKIAFALGLIDNANELDLTMTREEAAVRLTKLMDPLASDIDTRDFDKVNPKAFSAVANAVMTGLVASQNGYFYPQKPFTLEQAIAGSGRRFSKLRSIIHFSLINISAHVTVGKNYVYIDFETPKDQKDYIDYVIQNVMKKIKITGKFQRIDAGYAIIELYSKHDVMYTFKENVSNVYINESFGSASYGTGVYNDQFNEGYIAEPRVLKAGEIPNMVMQPDSTHQKLYTKIDKILAQIITPKMTDEQKVKVIHDYVVTHIVYGGLRDTVGGEAALYALETGGGTCSHYTSLFHYMATRASITTYPLQGTTYIGRHAWNIVQLNGKWVFVDTTFDDSKKKMSYDYYLKDTFYMMDTHGWTGFGYPAQFNYPTIDGMNIQTTEELRVYILQRLSNFTDHSPDIIKFKVTGTGVNTDISFMRSYIGTPYKLKYDAKSGIYTVYSSY
ncbi:MAG: transglutaminase domain-containing protein [Candidatus Cohnella colombiensis]|uniref:Transglutaminase domain-containing protein n=1 Tax=Candidatus Cohnella colombiensis TaxID=3121368 RepID=A0AA95EWW2_9BACL|nr:MAG: transglutaminase domain-containing protein [Cohnella sp.]